MKKVLKLKRPHPERQMRLGRHSITQAAVEYDLNEAEAKELETKGCKHWFEEAKLVEKKSKNKSKKASLLD